MEDSTIRNIEKLISTLDNTVLALRAQLPKRISQVYFGEFASEEGVLKSFRDDYDAENIKLPEGSRIIFAEYKFFSYEGQAIVLYVTEDGKLFEVNGSHCSCNGLEDQWDPEETSGQSVMSRLTNEKYFYKFDNLSALENNLLAEGLL